VSRRVREREEAPESLEVCRIAHTLGVTAVVQKEYDHGQRGADGELPLFYLISHLGKGGAGERARFENKVVADKFG
jgi:hypothetical protein